jgi:predicted GIY-YIG superfamily endonuclease
MNVYLIQSSKDGSVVIGVAKDIERRLKSLQMGRKEELLLVGYISCDSYGAAFNIQLKLENMFKAHRLRGGWFKSSLNLARLEKIKLNVQWVSAYTESQEYVPEPTHLI